jgi:hypothetical protein
MTGCVMPNTGALGLLSNAEKADVDSAVYSVDDEVKGAVDAVFSPVLQLRSGCLLALIRLT